MKKIAVTGGLSSGKSTVCLFLKELGAYVVSADAIIHQLLSSDVSVKEKVVQLLGSDILTENQIDRKKIAKTVFSDPIKLKELEKILHPPAFKEIVQQYEQVKNNPSYIFFVAEIPLLYETGMEKLFDKVIVISTDKSVALSRYLKTTDLLEKDFNIRMSYQQNPSQKETKADFVIVNNGDLAALKTNVASIVHQLKEHFSE